MHLVSKLFLIVILIHAYFCVIFYPALTLSREGSFFVDRQVV